MYVCWKEYYSLYVHYICSDCMYVSLMRLSVVQKNPFIFHRSNLQYFYSSKTRIELQIRQSFLQKKDECVSFVSLSVEYWKSSWNMSDIVKSWFLGNSKKKKFVLLTIFRCEYLYSCLINLDLLSLEVWCTVLWNLEKYSMKHNGFFFT